METRRFLGEPVVEAMAGAAEGLGMGVCTAELCFCRTQAEPDCVRNKSQHRQDSSQAVIGKNKEATGQ